ncbi:MAG: hypothetical protein ACKO96_12530, partial [Flammeovirgaceae bacterium]
QYAALLPTTKDDTTQATSRANAKVQAELSTPFLKQYTSLLKDTKLRDSLKGEGIKLAKQNLEQQLKDRYGLTQVEAIGYFSGDSAVRKKVRQKNFQLAKQKSMESLPPNQRKQLEAYQKEYGPYSREVKQYLYFLKDSVDTMDTLKRLTSAKMEVMAKGTVGNQLGGEAKQMNDYVQKLDELKKQQTDYKKQVDEYNDPNKL